MKFPKIEVAYSIKFNNTGLEWHEIQNASCDIIERDYEVLHMISDKYYEESDIGAKYINIKDVDCLLYFKVNTKELNIDIIAIRTDYNELINKLK